MKRFDCFIRNEMTGKSYFMLSKHFELFCSLFCFIPTVNAPKLIASKAIVFKSTNDRCGQRNRGLYNLFTNAYTYIILCITILIILIKLIKSAYLDLCVFNSIRSPMFAVKHKLVLLFGLYTYLRFKVNLGNYIIFK